MFNRRKKEQRLLEKISMIKPTSKSALKQQCLYMARMDVEKAEKMYDFLIRDMEELPAIDPAQKSFIENMGGQVSGVFKWIRENQDMLSQGLEMVKGIIAKRKGVPPLPPING